MASAKRARGQEGGDLDGAGQAQMQCPLRHELPASSIQYAGVGPFVHAARDCDLAPPSHLLPPQPWLLVQRDEHA